LDLGEKIAKLGNNLKNVIQSIIDPKKMRELARNSGFVKRCTSRLDGDEFVQTLIIESVNGEKNTLRGSVDTLKQITSKAVMTVQAFSKRMNTEAAANFIEGMFEKTLYAVMNLMNEVTKFNNKVKLLDFFPNVYLQDSTESLLDAELKDSYKGSGGGSGNGKGDASVKIDLIYEYKKKLLAYFKVTDRTEPDTILGKSILEFIKRGDLVIRDLGYSNINVFQLIQEAGAYFLSRLHSSLTIYLDPRDTQPISVGSFLQQNVKKTGVFDKMIYLSREMFHCRLIAYRVPSEIEKSRRDEYLKECKKKKRKPNQEYIKRLSFTIFITNVPVTIWAAEVIGTIYRLRWQVELIFKSWKSDLNFDCFKGKKPFRIKCLIYARLTAILMMFTVYSCIDSVALDLLEKEISIHKVIDWLTKNGRFFGVVIKGFGKELWDSMLEDASRVLCKERRKDRLTTRDLIAMGVPFGV
jgi:hypothetical protein